VYVLPAPTVFCRWYPGVASMRTRCGLRNPLRLWHLRRVFLRKYLRLNHLTCFWQQQPAYTAVAVKHSGGNGLGLQAIQQAFRPATDLREAFGVRGACSRFRLPPYDSASPSSVAAPVLRSRTAVGGQAGRAPYASRGRSPSQTLAACDQLRLLPRTA
jgi:hypothetical protein